MIVKAGRFLVFAIIFEIKHLQDLLSLKINKITMSKILTHLLNDAKSNTPTNNRRLGQIKTRITVSIGDRPLASMRAVRIELCTSS